MAEEPDVPMDITPEEFDGEQEKPKEETPKAESSPAKEEKPEGDKTPVEKEEAKAESPEETESEEKPADKAEPEADKPEEKPQKGLEKRTTQLNTEIRDLVAQRNALKTEVEKANAEVYQPATEQELVDDGMTATDAKVEALRQQIEVRDFNERVAEAQLTIESESNRILQDFSTFNPDSEDFDEELSNEAAQLLDANLIRDPNTQQIIGSNVSPYQLYKTLARAKGISEAKGQIKGQQATQQMLANADSASSAAPPVKPKDPLAELWKDEL